MKNYQNKHILKEKYRELGSTRPVGKFFDVSNGTVCYWLRKFHLPRNPRLELQMNNSGEGRRGELYIAGHPYFKKDIVDVGKSDDKARKDLVWRNDTVDVKTTHYKGRPVFRIKKKHHVVNLYICLRYLDEISPLIPVEIWIIPSNKAAHAGITVSLEGKSKYNKYKLSLERGKSFSVEDEKRYNQKFEKKFSWLLKNRKK